MGLHKSLQWPQRSITKCVIGAFSPRKHGPQMVSSGMRPVVEKDGVKSWKVSQMCRSR